ncbi:hypothetical protein ACFU6K_09415 [Kitasatospora sp. NPDC057512]|uniref:hypothetical protein n=1 Tax=Kitasatospora sp. NPDC057512 TaxID=3346154 RepID=UPI0036821E1F
MSGFELTGVVRGFHQRQQQGSSGDQEVWQFRVERYDTDGNKLKPVPVEMRGYSFTGSVSDGDEVHVRGRWREGTLHTQELTNLTTHARVRCKTYRVLLIVVGVIFALIVLGFILGILLSGVLDPPSSQGPLPGWPSAP